MVFFMNSGFVPPSFALYVLWSFFSGSVVGLFVFCLDCPFVCFALVSAESASNLGTHFVKNLSKRKKIVVF